MIALRPERMADIYVYTYHSVCFRQRATNDVWNDTSIRRKSGREREREHVLAFVRSRMTTRFLATFLLLRVIANGVGKGCLCIDRQRKPYIVPQVDALSERCIVGELPTAARELNKV